VKILNLNDVFWIGADVESAPMHQGLKGEKKSVFTDFFSPFKP